MLPEQLIIRNITSEIVFKTSRSSGPGGQNVNKVNSKVELRFNIQNSMILKDKEKLVLIDKLGYKLNAEGYLIIVSQEHRSQLQNKEAATKRFLTLLSAALTPVKKRRATKPTKASIERRLEKKKRHSTKKADRRYKAN